MQQPVFLPTNKTFPYIFSFDGARKYINTYFFFVFLCSERFTVIDGNFIIAEEFRCSKLFFLCTPATVRCVCAHAIYPNSPRYRLIRTAHPYTVLVDAQRHYAENRLANGVCVCVHWLCVSIAERFVRTAIQRRHLILIKLIPYHRFF